MKSFLITTLVGLSLAGCTTCKKFEEGVRFLSPEDGETVTSPVVVKIDTKGMRVLPAGKMNEKTGHHHIIVNGKPIKSGLLVPKDERHIHYGGGQTEMKLKLPRGSHTLTLQFADGLHRSYGPKWSETITVHVK